MNQRTTDRIEALLGVAAHPRTPAPEARTALAGARAAIEKAGATDQYALRLTTLGMAIAVSEVIIAHQAVLDAFALAAQKVAAFGESQPAEAVAP